MKNMSAKLSSIEQIHSTEIHSTEIHGDEVHGDKIGRDKIVIYQVRSDGTAAAFETSISPPLEPSRPPKILNFVGRDEELSYFAKKLTEQNMAVIMGMAGVGKTALAATLTQWVSEADNVFWHTFHEGEGIETVIRRLAGFLAWHGWDELWQLLEIARISGGQPPTTAEQVDYLIQLLRNGKYLLCFDDFHEVEHDPSFKQLISKLQNTLAQGFLSIIVTTRKTPDFVNASAFDSLAGLRSIDANQLLATTAVQLNTQQINALYEVTDGNAQFLMLTIAALNQGKEPDELIARLADSDDIQRYLLQEVDDTLSGDERSTMNAIAILLGYGGTRDVVEEILNGRKVFHTLSQLTNHHLLITQEVDSKKTYNQHSIVRNFYYDQLSRKQRQRMHQRAGEFYAEEQQTILFAGIHYERAGEIAEAAQLVTQDVLHIINQGEIRLLRTLLERFTKTHKQLSTKLWIEVNLAKGKVYTLQAEQIMGKESLQEAINNSTLLTEENDRRILQGKAYRSMAELLLESEPPAALKWLEKGLETLNDVDQNETAIIHILVGSLNFFLGDYHQALVSNQQGVSLLVGDPNPWRSTALIDLSGIHIHLGQFDEAIDYATQAIAICTQLGDPINKIKAIENLAIAQFSSGKTEAGLTNFGEASRLAEQIGNDAKQAQSKMNLGTAHLATGELDRAKQYFESALNIASLKGIQRTRLYALRNLSDLHVDEEGWEIAKGYLEQAEPLARELGDQHNLMTLFGLWCVVTLAEGDEEQALAYANRHWQLAIELEEVVQQGVSKANLGKTLAAMKRYDEAFSEFEQSLVLIAGENPYQEALTKMDWGKALLAVDRLEDGRRMLMEAQNKLRELDNLDLVEQINELLADS